MSDDFPGIMLLKASLLKSWQIQLVLTHFSFAVVYRPRLSISKWPPSRAILWRPRVPYQQSRIFYHSSGYNKTFQKNFESNKKLFFYFDIWLAVDDSDLATFNRDERFDVKKPGPFFPNSENNFFLNKVNFVFILKRHFWKVSWLSLNIFYNQKNLKCDKQR